MKNSALTFPFPSPPFLSPTMLSWSKGSCGAGSLAVGASHWKGWRAGVSSVLGERRKCQQIHTPHYCEHNHNQHIVQVNIKEHNHMQANYSQSKTTHGDWRSLGNWWSRKICKMDIQARPSFASSTSVCVSWPSMCVCAILHEYYVTYEWCNVQHWRVNLPLTHLSSSDKQTSPSALSSQPIIFTLKSHVWRWQAVQSISISVALD